MVCVLEGVCQMSSHMKTQIRCAVVVGAILICGPINLPESCIAREQLATNPAWSLMHLTVQAGLLVQSAALPSVQSEGPAKDVAELQALDASIGEWDLEATSQGPTVATGKVNARWILNGRFVEQLTSLTTKDGSSTVAFKTLMTFDPKSRKYRRWMFLTSGEVLVMDGVWNPKARVMTWVCNREEDMITLTADFGVEGIESWDIQSVDNSGASILHLQGTKRRITARKP